MTGGEKVGRPADPDSGWAPTHLHSAWDWRAYALQQEARAERAEKVVESYRSGSIRITSRKAGELLGAADRGQFAGVVDLYARHGAPDPEVRARWQEQPAPDAPVFDWLGDCVRDAGGGK
jgi:hypothetical protein